MNQVFSRCDEFSWSRDFFNKDGAYGLNDWDPAVAFVRALMENTEDKSWCWPHARMRILAGNSVLTQTFIQHFGAIRDARGIPIIIDKLGRLGPGDRAIVTPWCPEPMSLELLCLQALAQIGGSQARRTIDSYRHHPDKRYLAAQLSTVEIAPEPRPCVAPFPKDYPDILKPVRSYHDVLGEGGCDATFDQQQRRRILDAIHALQWPGIIETLSGDGHTTTFKLKNKINDHIHNFADPFSDFGIFLSNPKVEYPLCRRRWANSHTFLYFPIADGSLYGAEFSWNLEDNTITTHFHEHINCEAVTVNEDGDSVTVAQRPISTGVELRGNVFAKRCNSAVRGIWDNPDKTGKNYYARRANVLMPCKDLYYFRPLHEPIVNQLGIWVVDEAEQPQRFFSTEGLCTDVEGAVNELLIPLHEPKILAWDFDQYQPKNARDPHAMKLPQHMRVDLTAVPDASILDGLIGVEFEHSKCGNAGVQQNSDNGYRNGYDFNCNGVIDDQDRDTLARHGGEVYRMNVGDFGYFGFNWLSFGNRARSMEILERFIAVCAYDYGAGYDSDTGTVRLAEPVTPGTKLYIEYFHDAPPAPGTDNIRVYLHPDIA